MVAWWAGRPHYSWASMIAALERSEWVQVVVRIDSGLTTEGWFSGTHGVTAIKAPGRVQFDDRAAGVRLVCRAEDKVVGRQQLADMGAETTVAQLMCLLLSAELGD